MMNHYRTPNNHVPSVPTSHFRFHKVYVSVLVALGAVIGSMPLVEAQDKTVKTYTVTEMRNMRFGEILVVKASGIEIDNTTGPNDCPPELWDTLDLETLKKEFGAPKVEKNGPKF